MAEERASPECQETLVWVRSGRAFHGKLRTGSLSPRVAGSQRRLISKLIL